MKNLKFIPLLFATIIVLLCGCTNSTNIEITPDLDSAVSSAIIENNGGSYLEGECKAEGHIIFEAKQNENEIMVYTYIAYREYGFENGNFVDVSGMNVPVVIRLDTEYKLIDIQYPEDGAFYKKSIKKMFPKSCANKVLNISDENIKNINEQHQKYAQDYLKSINRNAKIGEMTDFDYPLLTDLGVSVDVSNHLCETIEKEKPYPYWIGNKEIIENGIRYVYQVDYDKKSQTIIFTKYEYENQNNIIEEINIDATNGNEIK